MRYRAPVAAAAFLISISATAGVFKDETDRFTGNRAVAWDSLPSKANEFSFSTVALFFKGSTTPGYYKVQLMTWGDSAEFRDCHHTNWLVDGVLDPYLEYEYSASSAGSAIIERFDKQMDRVNLQRLASAKLIEFQVCGTEGKISQSDMDGMRKVLDATK
ncbi:hypothetical protein [Pseudomonas veronii]|uniref:hypothetical protein n=1 Tax=Pseudomonas veronii TaxID=76761 RepID=UPI000F819CCE|nr:hypothetical protein [Pseudomonas veronii]RTY64334.1 hypothetical protein EKA83_32080 [Pseudomonas veronii]